MVSFVAEFDDASFTTCLIHGVDPGVVGHDRRDGASNLVANPGHADRGICLVRPTPIVRRIVDSVALIDGQL